MYHLVFPGDLSWDLIADCGKQLGNQDGHRGVYRASLLGAAADGLSVCPTCVAAAKGGE